MYRDDTSPYLLMQPNQIQKQPEFSNKMSPRFKINNKRQRIEPKSATLRNEGQFTPFNIEEKRRASDEVNHKKRQNHSLDRKQENNLDAQSNIQKASCSSSDGDKENDGSSDDSEEEGGSQSSSSSSSGSDSS